MHENNIHQDSTRWTISEASFTCITFISNPEDQTTVDVETSVRNCEIERCYIEYDKLIAPESDDINWNAFMSVLPPCQHNLMYRYKMLS